MRLRRRRGTTTKILEAPVITLLATVDCDTERCRCWVVVHDDYGVFLTVLLREIDVGVFAPGPPRASSPSAPHVGGVVGGRVLEGDEYGWASLGVFRRAAGIGQLAGNVVEGRAGYYLGV